MDQPISLRIIRLIVVMTHDYLNCYNVFLLIYRGYTKKSLQILRKYIGNW